MKIYITRHGETKWNKEGRMQGWQNSDLIENGVKGAKKLGYRLRDIDFDCIYCSPLGRAVATAEHIRQDKDTEIILVDSLREMGFGKWEGMGHDTIKELYPTEHFNFWNRPHLYSPIEGESFEELFERVKGVLNQIISNSSLENVLIVSHAVVIKAIYAIIRKYPLEELWTPPFLQGTSLTIVEVEENEINIILEADTSHLE
ncbi:histidine phosphatase family protein [Tissierella carlieri]|uniref:phosphoglycerate mutase (2,3-diphosphoglycerate-dependent) n=1 Tax=Tissierella carlieri TaxID=689904 RepID=A0ABT1SDL2_9FIRM|nr:histidine phosphatase family protein [Tissierella carlieri]MCQ4924509.1 histidine phosphatase family protein [Tissierella carlieri]